MTKFKAFFNSFSSKILLSLLVTALFVWLPVQHTVAQLKKAKKSLVAATSPLPALSPEVYQAIAQFYQYDKNIPLAPQIVATQDLPEGTRQKLVFIGIANSRVPAYLALPKVTANAYPVVILIDGITGSKDRWFTDESWPKGGLVTKALLRAGFAVMALDAVYHGERAADNNFAGVPNPFSQPYTANRMVMQTALEHRRAIDYLFTRPDMDTTRLGMLGLSMGGAITFALISVDARIKTAVAGLTPILKQVVFQPWMPTTFAPHVSTGSFLMFMGSKDNYYTMKEARELYERIPIKDKEFVEYSTDHTPPPEYVEKVKEWFTQKLKP